jgi:hypothetical protein
VTFCSFTFIYDIFYGVVEIINVGKGRFRSVIWVTLTCPETVVNAAGFTVLIHTCVCSCTAVRVKCYKNVLS